MRNPATAARMRTRRIGHPRRVDSRRSLTAITAAETRCPFQSYLISSLVASGVVVRSLVKVQRASRDAQVASVNSVLFRNHQP